MAPAELASLPVELLHHIASFMSVDEVLACSLTCHYLRNALNHDSVWKKHLPQQEMSDLIDIEEQKLPRFKAAKSFTSLCNNRMKYMRRTHLLNKWRGEEQVHCTEKSYYNYQACWSTILDTKGGGQIVYKSKYLFFSRFVRYDESVIEVWNVERVNKPFFYTKIQIENKYLSRFYIVGSCLVVIECDNVHVYLIDIVEKTFTLVYSFIIMGEEVKISESLRHVGEHNSTCSDWTYSVKDQYLIAQKCGEDVMHIWNILESFKVGSFVLPESNNRLFFVKYHSENYSDWIIQQTMYRPGTNVRYYFTFNVETKRLCNSFFKYNGTAHHLIFFCPHVILFEFATGGYDTLCRMVDFETNNEIKTRRFNNSGMNSKIESTTVVNGKFVILCADSFQVVDASNLETVELVPHDNSCFRCVLKQFNVFGTYFLLLSTRDNKCVVWDVKKSQSLFEMNEKTIIRVYLDQLCTKIIFQLHKDFTVLHFW